MRLSSSQIFDAGALGIQRNQSALYKTMNQLATGRRALTPADDPVAASQALVVTQARDVAAQYADNQGNGKAQLALEGDRLSSLVDVLQHIRERAVEGGNATYSDSQRASLATDLQQQFEQIVGLANSTDANGEYLFSGYQGATKPFSLMVGGNVQYFGDDGQRQLQMDASRLIGVSDSGRDLFERIHQGNGTFATAANAGNTGTGVVDPGSVLNSAAWTGNGYQLQFNVGGTYTVTDTTTAATIGTFPYVAGTAITAIPGISLSIRGTPATGDTFTVAPSTSQSIFSTVQNLISALKTPTAGDPAAAAQLQNSLGSALVNLDQGLDNVARVQATVGSRMAELTSLTELSGDIALHYQETLSGLQDLDYVKAISDFAKQKDNLDAAQKSFSQISSLSLFKLL